MIDVTPSSGNVFKDLGLPNPEERLAKAKLAHKIRCLIADQKMTQKDAAVFLGLSRYKMRELRDGGLKIFTIADLFALLGKLDSLMNPNNRDLLRCGIEAYRRDGPNAIADYTDVISLNPDTTILSNAYYNRGRACWKKGDNDRAIADYTKAIELDPGDSHFYLVRGIVYHSQQEYDRAIADFTKASELDPAILIAIYRAVSFTIHNRSMTVPLQTLPKH